MSNLIGVINYGIAGNIFSVNRAIQEAGGKTFIINDAADFGKADKIVLPGVGSFSESMNELEASGFVDKILEFQGPILGICLGMQILSRIGFEFGVTHGLNLLEAEVRPILSDGKIPHMGFNKLNVVKSNELLSGVEDEEFYFMHSYVATLTVYCGHSFVSSVRSGNLYGVQFHPEKSRDAGIRLLNNFVQLD